MGIIGIEEKENKLTTLPHREVNHDLLFVAGWFCAFGSSASCLAPVISPPALVSASIFRFVLSSSLFMCVQIGASGVLSIEQRTSVLPLFFSESMGITVLLAVH